MMEEAIQRYLWSAEHISNFAPKTIEEYGRVIRFIYSRFDFTKAERPSEIDEAIIRSGMKSESRPHGWSQNYMAKMAFVMMSFCRWMHEEGYLDRNVYPATRIRKARPKKPKFLTEGQYKDLLAHPFVLNQDRLLMKFLWNTAVRPEEATLVEPEDVVFNETGGILRIPAAKSKGGYGEREIPFGHDLAYELKPHLEFVSSIENRPAKGIFFNKAFRPMSRVDMTERMVRIGLINNPYTDPIYITPYMFRHGRGVHWLLNGVPEVVVMRWLGHNSLSMTAHYINLAAEYSQRFMKKCLPQEFSIPA